MGVEKIAEHRVREEAETAVEPTRPDTALGVWMSWMESSFGHAQNWMSNVEPWWTVTPDQMAGNMLEAGSKQLNDILARDPLLRSIDQMWNANPFREIVPVGRLGQASEIARGVLFLVADEGGFITGSTLSINGGQHMY